MALLELIYTSRSTAKPGTSHVQDILASAEKNNVASFITGLLLFDGERYIQVLEGEAENVEKIYDIIFNDDRHDTIELLHNGPILGRSFEGWRMAYDAIPKGLLEGLSEHMGVVSLELEPDDIAGPGESFGARLNGMFIEAVAAE